jgi:hypothetical protein
MQAHSYAVGSTDREYCSQNEDLYSGYDNSSPAGVSVRSWQLNAGRASEAHSPCNPVTFVLRRLPLEVAGPSRRRKALPASALLLQVWYLLALPAHAWAQPFGWALEQLMAQ